MVTSQSRQNHCLVHPPRLRPNPLTTPCLCWCCRSASTCPGRSNLWNQMIGDQKIPSPPHRWDGPHRQLLYTMEYQGPWKENVEWVVLQNFLGHFHFETGKTCARVVCVLGWWWWRRDWCPLQPPSTSSYGGCFLPPERNDLQVGLFQCVLSKITGFGFHLLLEISQQDNMISLDICQRGGRSKRLLWESRHWRS